MFYVIIGNVHKNYGSNLSVIAILTDENRVQEVLDEAESSTHYLITDTFVIEVETLDELVFAVNEDQWDYSDE